MTLAREVEGKGKQSSQICSYADKYSSIVLVCSLQSGKGSF